MALWVLSGHRSELQGLSSLFSHLHWWWLPVAVAVEAASFVAFAGVQYRLLSAGGVYPPVIPLIGMTVGAQAISNSLPAGAALAAVYGYRWFRRFGADETVSAWALIGTGVTAAVSLALVAAAGLAVAAELGASLDLIGAVIGVLLVTLAVGGLFVYERPLAVVVTWSVHTSRRLLGRPRGDVAATIGEVVQRLTVVRLGWRDIGAILGWGSANWLLDCACFAFSFLAVGADIPWEGLLLAYGAGQLAANLPITPGGLGAVEGSITIALVAFGGDRTTTVEAVVIYRLISFWAELVVGWAAVGIGALQVRAGRWPRSVAGLAPDLRHELGDGPEESPLPSMETGTEQREVGG